MRTVPYFLAGLGLTTYMFLCGAELEPDLLGWSQVRRSGVLAAAGIVPSFLLGAGVSFLYYDQLAGPGVSERLFAVFLGAGLSITAFPMLARILDEEEITRTRMCPLHSGRGRRRRRFRLGHAGPCRGTGHLGQWRSGLPTFVGAILFAVVMLTIGRRALTPLACRVERRGSLAHDDVTVILLVVLASAWFTDAIGFFSVFGGFVAGLALPPSPVLRRELRARLSDLTMILFLPVFFAYSGLNTEINGLNSWTLIVPFLALLGAAVIAGTSAAG